MVRGARTRAVLHIKIAIAFAAKDANAQSALARRHVNSEMTVAAAATGDVGNGHAVLEHRLSLGGRGESQEAANHTRYIRLEMRKAAELPGNLPATSERIAQTPRVFFREFARAGLAKRPVSPGPADDIWVAFRSKWDRVKATPTLTPRLEPLEFGRTAKCYGWRTAR